VNDQPEALRVADGGPAFPVVDPVTISSYVIPGMTLRDYFAARAMQAKLQTSNGSLYDKNWRDDAAMGAYLMADAMLKFRSKT
jgi:hypothetical protein